MLACTWATGGSCMRRSRVATSVKPDSTRSSSATATQGPGASTLPRRTWRPERTTGPAAPVADRRGRSSRARPPDRKLVERDRAVMIGVDLGVALAAVLFGEAGLERHQQRGELGVNDTAVLVPVEGVEGLAQLLELRGRHAAHQLLDHRRIRERRHVPELIVLVRRD